MANWECVIDNEAGFHSDLPDVFESEVTVKAHFVCCTWKGVALADNKWHMLHGRCNRLRSRFSQ